MTVNLIQTDYEAGPTPSAELAAAYDASANVLRTALGFLDPATSLAYVYGSAPPETFNGQWPFAFHYPAAAADIRSLTFGSSGAIPAHTGGHRIQKHYVKLAWAVGDRAEGLPALAIKTLFWLRAIDMAYSANTRLEGTIQMGGMTGATWGPITLGDKTAFGWTCDLTWELWYLQKASA